MAPELPMHEFDVARADRYRPNASYVKTTVLVDTPADAITIIRAPFGEQTLKGAFYAVAEGNGSYGASRAEFEQTHEQVGPNRWVKREQVLAYRATDRCIVETFVGGTREATVLAQRDDWIVQQATGEVMVITPSEFAARYEPAQQD